MSVAWQGVYPAVTTQFHADGGLDIPATLAHIDRLIDAGLHGLIMLGTVGENCSLEYAEKLEILPSDRRPRRRPGTRSFGSRRIHHPARMPVCQRRREDRH